MCMRIIRKRNIIKERNIKGKIIIGIIGTHIGVGSTHFSILLSNYMSECLGKKTACIECCPQNELTYMEEQYSLYGNATSTNESFSIYKVHYYKSIREDRIAGIMGNGYDCVVLDLGIDVNKMKNELLRCDKKIVIGNLAPWKSNELEGFFERTESIREYCNLEFGISFSTNKIVKGMSRQFRFPLFCIPFEPDPFVISTDTIKMFQRII